MFYFLNIGYVLGFLYLYAFILFCWAPRSQQYLCGLFITYLQLPQDVLNLDILDSDIILSLSSRIKYLWNRYIHEGLDFLFFFPDYGT